MKKKKSKPVDERIRMTMAVSPKVDARIERLKDLSESESRTEVIRRALKLYEDLLAVHEDGGRVLLEAEDGTRTVVRLIW